MKTETDQIDDLIWLVSECIYHYQSKVYGHYDPEVGPSESTLFDDPDVSLVQSDFHSLELESLRIQDDEYLSQALPQGLLNIIDRSGPLVCLINVPGSPGDTAVGVVDMAKGIGLISKKLVKDVDHKGSLFNIPYELMYMENPEYPLTDLDKQKAESGLKAALGTISMALHNHLDNGS